MVFSFTQPLQYIFFKEESILLPSLLNLYLDCQMSQVSYQESCLRWTRIFAVAIKILARHLNHFAT
jgi:hypothetical protein